MAEEIHHPDGRIEHPTVHYERSDASFAWIMAILVGAAAFGAIVFTVLLAFFDHERKSYDDTRRARFPLASNPSLTLPPEPRLDALDRLPTAASIDRKSGEQRLTRFGAAEERFVHVPIARAMQYLANKLPARTDATPRAAWEAADAIGMAAAPSGQAWLVTAAALFPGKAQLEQAGMRHRDRGLVNSGASNSGRLLSGRTPP